MNKYLTKLAVVFVIVASFSSCSVEKRLYSSGYRIQLNAKAGENFRLDKTDQKKYTSFNKTTATNKSTANDIIDNDNNKVFISLQQPLQKSNSYDVNKVYDLGENQNIKKTIYSVFKFPTLVNSEKIIVVPKPRPGESNEEMAERKANKSLFYGIISIPTLFFFFIGILFGVIAIILGQQARKLSPEDGPIKKRATAGINVAIICFSIPLFLIVYFYFFPLRY